MEIPKDKKIYFSSDNHLGLTSLKESHDRERFLLNGLIQLSMMLRLFFYLVTYSTFGLNIKRLFLKVLLVLWVNLLSYLI